MKYECSVSLPSLLPSPPYPGSPHEADLGRRITKGAFVCVLCASDDTEEPVYCRAVWSQPSPCWGCPPVSAGRQWLTCSCFWNKSSSLLSRAVAPRLFWNAARVERILGVRRSVVKWLWAPCSGLVLSEELHHTLSCPFLPLSSTRVRHWAEPASRAFRRDTRVFAFATFHLTQL